MKKSLIFILSIIFSIVLCSHVNAKVTGLCSNCHTMHNSQGGASMLFTADLDSAPNPALTRGDCIGCHAQSPSGENIVTGIPQVSHGGDDLAAGNFKYLSTNQNRGHNVQNIAVQDTDLFNTPPGYLSDYDPAATDFDTVNRLVCAGQNGCHGNRDQSDQFAAISGAHHGDDSCLKFGDIAEGLQGASVATSYRFLYKVKGGEDADWQDTIAGTDHNEYKGVALATPRTTLSWGAVDTISELCAECHGNYHYSDTDTGIGAGSPWLRHPTDRVLPNSGEYTAYTTYSPTAPVARQSIPDSASSGISLNSDVIMCLSCHGAHATNFYKLMRWDYASSTLSTALEGCAVCHTTKN